MINMHLKNRLLLLFLCISVITGCNSAQRTTGTRSMIPTGAELGRILKAGEIHQYNLTLKQGEFAHINAKQNGIDVIVKVSDTVNRWQQIYDSPNGELDSENIYLLSTNGNDYLIEVYPAQKYADPGVYSMEIKRLEKAGDTDIKWMDALRSTQQAGTLRAKAETRKQSIEQYKTSIAKWIEIKDDRQQANATRSLGFVYIREKEYEKAVQVFEQLLPLWYKLGDTRSAGFTQLIIGRIYSLQKMYSKNLEYNLRSLEDWRKAKDYDQESFVLMEIGNMYTQLNEKQKSIDYFEQSLKMNEQSKRPSIKAVILRDYASAMLQNNENEKAKQLFEQSIQQWKSTANREEEARTDVMLAAQFTKQNDQQNALRHYQHALEIWNTLDEKNEIKKVQELMDKAKN